MNYCEYQSLLSQYLDRQLKAETTQCLEMHLPHCPRCSRELKELDSIRQVCMNIPEVEIPEGLHQSIMNRVRRERQKDKLSWARRAIIPLAAALLIFFIGRGLPGVLNNFTKQTAEQALPESMIMAIEDDSDFAADLSDMPTDGRAPAPAAGSPDAHAADKADKEEIKRSAYSGSQGETAEDKSEILAASDMVSEDHAKADSPNYYRYGILIAAILAFGIILLKTLKPRR